MREYRSRVQGQLQISRAKEKDNHFFLNNITKCYLQGYYTASLTLKLWVANSAICFKANSMVHLDTY